jgi:hypothetical protein
MIGPFTPAQFLREVRAWWFLGCLVGIGIGWWAHAWNARRRP